MSGKTLKGHIVENVTWVFLLEVSVQKYVKPF